MQNKDEQSIVVSNGADEKDGNTNVMEMTEEKLDEMIQEQIDKNFYKRVESYIEALKELEKKYPKYKNLISEDDIKKLANYEEIEDRPEIKLLKKVRNQILFEEKKKAEKLAIINNSKLQGVKQKLENAEKDIEQDDLKIKEKLPDKKLNKEIDFNLDKRIKSYHQALEELGKKYPEYKETITEEDIMKLATFEDKDIKSRVDIRMLNKIRNKILSQEEKEFEKQLNKELIKEINSSEVLSTAITKGIMVGLLGPLAIGFVAARQIIDINQARDEIKKELLTSIDTGEKIDLNKTITFHNNKMGSLYNLDGFLENIQKSDEFKNLKDNKEEKKKLLETINNIQRESFDFFCELEDFVEEKEEERIERLEREEEEDPEPEPGMKLI